MNDSLTTAILKHLRLSKASPTLPYLQSVITAYCKYVPWESVSRIVKKSCFVNPVDCLRMEEEFWTAALQQGTGGTCYESNWAFFCFLESLGFEGYLTINKVVDKKSSHSSVVIIISNKKYIVDIGYPTYAPILFGQREKTVTYTPFICYQSTNIGENEYIVENTPHPKPYLFNLIDVPVKNEDYLNAAIQDYGHTGLFLDRIVIRKLVDGMATRFDSKDLPFNIHVLKMGERQRTLIKSDNLINVLSSHFKMNTQILEHAFVQLGKTTSA